jgi:Calcium binding
MEIVVDCYNESEAWSGWWCYLDGKLACPFEAECIHEQRVSPLKMGERVSVTGMLDDDKTADSLGVMQVEIAWQGRTLGVPLTQLRGVGVAEETAEAIADWHYWVAQGRRF